MMMPLEFVNFVDNLSHLLMWYHSFFITEHTFVLVFRNGTGHRLVGVRMSEIASPGGIHLG